ncbi:MAG: 30S ribosomal protein S6 [Planctomycetota bacterium]
MTKKKLYEAMFLVDSADAGSDWDRVIGTIKKVLERAKVDIVSIKKWDDRRLAYEIKSSARGTYILCYFRSDGQTNTQIEKAVQLSEKIIRVLILCVDWMTDEDIEKDTPAMKEEKEKQQRAAAREAAEQAKEDKSQTEASVEIEPAEEASPAKATAAADEVPPAQEALEAQATEPGREPEPAEAESGDSAEAQPKASADD